MNWIITTYLTNSSTVQKVYLFCTYFVSLYPPEGGQVLQKGPHPSPPAVSLGFYLLLVTFYLLILYYEEPKIVESAPWKFHARIKKQDAMYSLA